MELPKELIREFAASTNDQVKTKTDTTCYGTALIQNGKDFVQIDGADGLTPAIYTVSVKNGDRVLIMLKGRKALVIGNITSPYLMVGTLEANDGIIVNGYLTTNPDRTTYDSTSAAGLTISNGGIGAYQGGSAEKRWYGKNDGSFYASSAEITGTITAKNGNIGGFTIGENKLYTGDHNAWNANNAGVFISPDYIALGANGTTYLKKDGTFQFGGANGITFSDNKVRFGSDVVLTWGSISDKPDNIATTDDIPSGILTTSNYTGTITKTYIDGLNVIAQNISGTTLSGKTISGGEIKIGTPSNNVYPFQVTSAGVLTASGANISGTLKAGANSTIGPWTVSATSIYKGNAAHANAGGMYFGNDGLSITNKFYVTSAGVPYCNGANLYINSVSVNAPVGLALSIGGTSFGSLSGANLGNGTVRSLTLSTDYNLVLDGKDVYISTIAGGNIHISAGTLTSPGLTRFNSGNVEIANSLSVSGGITGYLNGNCSGSSGSCTGHAASDLALTGGTITGNLTVNGTITGSLTGNVTGNCSGSSGSCTGHAASDLALSGGTISGNLGVDGQITCGSSSSTSGQFVKVWNNKHQGSLHADTSGRLGIYSDTKSCWAFYIDTAGEIYGHFAHSQRSDKIHKIVGSTATDGQRVEFIRYGDTSGVVEFYAQDGSSGSSYGWRKPASSDIRLKENVKESTVDSLSILNKVKLYSFDWKGRKDHWDVGFIANYIVDVDPKLAYAPKADDEMYAINTFYMQGHIVKAIQQLTARIEELEKKLKGAA